MPLKVVPRRDRKLHRLVKRGEILSLKRGELLFRAGDPAEEAFLVRTGYLRLTTPEGEGMGETVAIVGPWELTGEEGLRRGVCRQFGATAGEGAQITVLDGAGTRRALQTAEKTFEAFLAAKEAEVALGRALTGLRKAGGARKRLGLLLLNLADRLGRIEEGGTRIPLRLTHQLLAELSASHRSTVTTILNDWIYRGFLERDSGFLLIRAAEKLD